MSLRCACVLALAAALPGQKLCADSNPTGPWAVMTPLQEWFAIPFTLTTPTTVSALQFRLRPAVDTAAGLVGLWSESGGKPGTLLARASLPAMPGGVSGWYGAAFATPPRLAAGRYFLALRHQRGLQVQMPTAGPVTQHWWQFQGQWRGPAKARWSWRMYCDVHGGTSVVYGSGKVGEAGQVPQLRLRGFPNTGNPIGVQLARGALGGSGVFLLGQRAPVKLPFGDLLVTPLVALPFVTVGRNAGRGHATLELTLARNASWAGARLAFQAWLIDPAATAGLAHSDGVEIVLGH